MNTCAILCFLIIGCLAEEDVKKNSARVFPESFLFGAATASYQIEGGWNADDKGESIWDRMTHTDPSSVKDGSNGDIAADTYHNYKRDVEMMRELGLDAYRFSLSWSRILPTGQVNQISKAGIEFYNNYINEMLKYNITPIVTLYHWDLPQKIQELGGWTNPYIKEWFGDYSKVAYANFGDRVKHWITINEPREICYEGYGYFTKAPRVNATGIGEYICAKNLVLAHAQAYHIYNDTYKKTQGGVCGITISVNWFEPATDSEEDKFAAELMRQSDWGIYADPIFSEEGDFPKEFSQRVANKSAEQKFYSSRLPSFCRQDKKFVRGSSDFFGVNHYTTFLVSGKEHKPKYFVPSLLDDVDAGLFSNESLPESASSWLRLAPNSLFKALTHLDKLYKNMSYYITENGWSTTGGVDDDERVTYYRAALEDVLDAMDSGIKIEGYMAWSLMDNFEWMEGYTEKFGLYEVDFANPARTRTPRKSAYVYKDIIKKRKIDYDYMPSTEQPITNGVTEARKKKDKGTA